MKRSYSRWNLLQKKLSNITENKTWIDHIFFSSKYRYVELEIPYYEFLRGEIFCNDLKDLEDSLEADIPFNFGVNHLIDLLYIDFLNEIKKGVNYENISSYLVNQKYKYFKTEKRVMRQVETNLFTFENQVSSKDEEKTAFVTIRMKETEILRGEVFLYDLSESGYLSDEHILIEEVLVILYLDFIEKIKTHENALGVMKSIVLRF